jgi:hypothetical protein
MQAAADLPCNGTVTGFSLANLKLHGEQDQARQTLERQPANWPAPGTAVVTDKGLAGSGYAAADRSPQACRPGSSSGSWP